MDVVRPADNPRPGASEIAVPDTTTRHGVWRPALLTLAFMAVVTAVAVHHEPWFDEAQAWLIGRDCSLWELLAGRVRYEGSPGLWHALLWVLSHAGMPYEHLWMVSAALAGAAVWIVLRHAPFPYWLRIAVVCSYFMAYQYAVVARSYSLALLLLLLAAVTYAERLQRPILHGVILGLLANVSAHTFLIAVVLFADWALAARRADDLAGKRRLYVAAVLFVVCAAAAVLQAWQPSDANFRTYPDPWRIVTMIAAAFIDRFDLFATSPPSNAATLAGALVSLVLLVPSMLLFRRAGHLALVATIAVTMLVFSYLTHANAWHGGLLYLVWIFALWVSWPTSAALRPQAAKAVVASVALIVLVHDGYTLMAGWRDLNESNSAGPAAARLLASRRDRGIAAGGFKTFAIQPWFDRNIFANYHDGAEQPAYLRWRADETFHTNRSLELWRQTAASGRIDTLVLSTSSIPPAVIPDYVRDTMAAGFCEPVAVPGAVIWKSYVYEPDDLLIFYRCQ
jgi:hypothetical protein